jgi:uncharacterized protein YdaU (DUF1376 family)
MLDAYYLREGKLPKDVGEIARLIRLRDHAATIRDVLNEFFQETPDGWMHERCEEEILKMQDKQAKARASAYASVNARKAKANQTLSEGNANAERTLNERSTDVQLPTPTPTPTPTPNTKTMAVKRPEDVDQDVWNDFLAIRKAKRAVLTQTALDGIQREASKAGWSLNDAIRETVARGWQSFKADWVANNQNRSTETAYQKSQREAMEALAPGVARKAPFNPNIFEAENVTFIEGR